MNTDKYATIYIARHGETEWNKAHRIQGHSDSPLTADGIVQAQNLGRKFGDIKFEAVFSSDLARAKQTAEIVKAEREIAVITKNLLRERFWGELEGKTWEEHDNGLELKKKMDALVGEARRFFVAAPGYQSDDEIANRLTTVLREIAVAYAGKNVLVISHGGILRAFLAKLDPEFMDGKVIDNTGYAKILSDGIDFFIQETEGISQR